VLVLCCVTTHGPACNTVAGRTSPFESKSCVIPTFLPRIPATFAISFSIPSLARRYSTTSIGWRAIALAWGQPPSAVQAGQSPANTQLFMLPPERLDLDVHARRQIKLHQR